VANRRPQIAVIGAGPIGLEAALYAVEAGFDVSLYERGRVAQNINDWGHVRLFSPFGMNASPWGRKALALTNNEPPQLTDQSLLTGREFADAYLSPLSRLPQLDGHIYEGVEVISIGRSRTWKRDLPGQAVRGDDPFRLLVRDHQGERFAQADILFDCSGTFPNHNWIGAGGIPCIGEKSLLSGDMYRLPDVLGSECGRFAGRRTLVVGGGYSAATAVVDLAQLARTERSTRIVWLTRSSGAQPLARVDDDSLSQRDTLAETANALALEKEGPVHWMPDRLIEAVARRDADDRFVVSVRGHAGSASALEANAAAEDLVVDCIVANVGYRPQRALYEELQVHECYASQGPMKLAAVLAGETSPDCLAQASPQAETLQNPEPGFFILGSKSYGRDSRFLLKIGIEQIQAVFATLATTGPMRSPSTLRGGRHDPDKNKAVTLQES
jgi:hypothetical protein